MRVLLEMEMISSGVVARSANVDSCIFCIELCDALLL